MDIEIKESSQPKEPKKIVGVQLPISMFLKLKQISDERYISISDIIRGVLFKYLSDDSN